MKDTSEKNRKNSCTGEEKSKPEDFICETYELNDIKKTVAVLSGKGGVGKSLVTSLLAVVMRRKGYQVGILDADITGPSIPKVFGGDDYRADTSEFGIYPARTHNDIRIMSINLLLEKNDAPVIWRGPLIAGAVKQFWTDVIWGKLDYLFFDMPPGTGDVPLTVFQSIPLDGIIIVTSPQDLVSLIVKKAYNMAKTMNIPILGIIENMSYAVCPGCGMQINIFGESKAEKVAQEMDIPFLGRLPVDPDLAVLCDKGEIEKFEKNYVDECIDMLEKMDGKESSVMKIAAAAEGRMVAEHFGHCEGFDIFTVENGKISGREFVQNPGHQPGFLPNYLNDLGVNTVIAGGMGGGAIQIFNEKGIKVITGASGEIEETVQNFLNGQLKSSGSVCKEHQHSDSCGGH